MCRGATNSREASWGRLLTFAMEWFWGEHEASRDGGDIGRIGRERIVLKDTKWSAGIDHTWWVEVEALSKRTVRRPTAHLSASPASLADFCNGMILG